MIPACVVTDDERARLAHHTFDPDRRTIGSMVRADGFALVPQLASVAAADDARTALTAAAAALANRDRPTWHNPKGTSQIAWASRLVPRLADSPIRSAALALAADIIGGRVVERFDYALVTPPHGPGAPWHRDADSFTLAGVDRRVHVWVALQDVDENNGCLSYVPRTAEQRPPDAAAISCPVAAGSALVHDEQCLHRSSPNTTEGPRWAWILQYAAAGPVRRVLFAADRSRATVMLSAARRRLYETPPSHDCSAAYAGLAVKP